MEVYVNGRFRPLDDPALPARDRGFLSGEAVYESVKVAERRALFLDSHLERLAASAGALGFEAGWGADELSPVLARLLDAAGLDDALARLYLTLGPAGDPPTRIVWVEPLPPHAAGDTAPWRLVRHPERLVPYRPDVKHTSRLAHALARRRAKAAGADDALLLHADGWVLEGTASNVFFFEADTLHTPETGCGVLPGITRDLVLELAPSCGFKTVEGRYPVEVLAAADEVFLTFTSAGVRPVASIDGRELAGGAPGPRTARIGEAYEARVAETLAHTPPLG
ncbi:MAG: aminotransferase class IV [Gemmatimonadetes bacterium]|nr:aminotransferase class IV [Gemmatimonadota bacterium]